MKGLTIPVSIPLENHLVACSSSTKWVARNQGLNLSSLKQIPQFVFELNSVRFHYEVGVVNRIQDSRTVVLDDKSKVLPPEQDLSTKLEMRFEVCGWSTPSPEAYSGIGALDA